MSKSLAWPRALRILHVANFGFKPVKVYLHGTAAKLTNGWIRAGHHVANFSDRDIARWAGLFGHRKWGILPANRILREFGRHFRPDVIALGHADIIRPETIAAMREDNPSVKVLQWNFDPLFAGDDASSDDNRRRILAKIEVVDATFVTTAGEVPREFAGPGRIAGFMPNPVDLAIERGRNFERTDLPRDVFFAAGFGDDKRFHCGQWRHVDTFCNDIQRALPDVAFSFHGVLGQPHVWGTAYEDALLSCRMGLNMSRRNDIPLYSSDRISHLAGNGLAVLIDRASQYGTLFGEEAFAFYSSEAELFETIARLKRDDARRRAMAEAGWRRYHALFDSKIVGQYMLDALYGEHDPSQYEWPTLV